MMPKVAIAPAQPSIRRASAIGRSTLDAARKILGRWLDRLLP